MGVIINKNNNYDSIIYNKFKNVQKSVFSLSFIGLKPMSIQPHLQSFLYKTYCLSTFNYGLETTTISKKIINKININQNNLIRQIIGLKRKCKMTNIRKSLKLFSFEQLYIFSKINFINSIKNNEICMSILEYLNKNTDRNYKKYYSFKADIIKLENHFSCCFNEIIKKPIEFKNLLYKIFYENNGLIDSIKFCLTNYRNNYYRNILNNLLYY